MTPKINPWKVTGYKQGQNVSCKVNYAEKDGYAVTILKDNLPGFIKTANTLKAGDEILGVFVCVHNGRILLSQLFSAPRKTAHQLSQTTVNWEEHLDDDTLNEAYEKQAMTQRNQRLGITEDPTYQPPQSPTTDFSQYQQGAATSDIPPVNPGQQSQDYSQFASPQQGQEGNNQQGQPAAQAYPSAFQYDNAQANPYQNPSQNQYDQSQTPAWANPQQDQYVTQEPGQGHNQNMPESQFQADLLSQQQAAQQAANGYVYGQPGQPGQQIAYGQQAQYDSGQQNPHGQSNSYQGGQQAQLPAPVQQTYQQPAAQEQQWQSPHSQVPSKKFRLRRAIDLVMPPVDQESLEGMKSFKIADYDMEWLITDLEGGMRTGCIKATSEQKLSRSAALLYKGRAVGCIYGCKANPDAKPTEESLSSMLSDLEAPDAVVTLYDLPEDAALSMSALFLGYPIDSNPEMTSREYCDFVMKWFAENNSTACLAVTVSQTKSTYLVFVHKGKFSGAFFVEEQQFTRDANEIISMFNQHPDARIEASILNADTLNSGMRFGYSLSMARQKRSGF